MTTSKTILAVLLAATAIGASAQTTGVTQGQPATGATYRPTLDGQQAWAMWLREDAAGAQSLWLSRRSPDLATEYERIEVARPQGRGRGTGFPQLQAVAGQAYVVWTDVVDGAPTLRGVRVQR